MQRGLVPGINLDIFYDQDIWQQATKLLHKQFPLLEEISFQQPEEIPDWTDSDIELLYDCLLEESLRTLFNRNCSLETTTEIYRWIADDNDSNPFSFNKCCLISGLNPDVIRISVLFEFDAIRIRNLH